MSVLGNMKHVPNLYIRNTVTNAGFGWITKNMSVLGYIKHVPNLYIRKPVTNACFKSNRLTKVLEFNRPISKDDAFSEIDFPVVTQQLAIHHGRRRQNLSI